jgi:pilus assembly protein CpaB
MNTKLVFLLMLALGCGILAAVAASQMMSQQAVPTQQLTEILVASENLELGTKITKERFKLEKWPSDRLPSGAILVAKDVEGKYTNQPLYAGEPLLDRKIMDSLDFVSTKIPLGYKLFDMSLGDSSTYINPGDRVDIFGYFQKSSSIAQTKTMRILQNVQVLMVDGIAVRPSEVDGRKSAKTCQLLIKDSQYEALTTAANLGKLRLAMCGLNINEISEGKADNGEEFLAWVEDSVGGNSSPTAGAPQFQPEMFVSAPAVPPVEEKEEFSMVVYSGGIPHEYRWQENQLPTEVGGSKSKPATTNVTTSAKIAPTEKFNGSNTIWDPTNEEWSESDLKSEPSQADSKLETTDAQTL